MTKSDHYKYIFYKMAFQIMGMSLPLTRGPQVLVEVDGLEVEASRPDCWLDDKMLAEYRAFISFTSCIPSSSLNTSRLLYSTSGINCTGLCVKHFVRRLNFKN
jgi:hypothetical protein